jgi:hypothetical protein
LNRSQESVSAETIVSVIKNLERFVAPSHQLVPIR